MVAASLVCVSDYESQAAALLPKQVYDYYRSGADDQQTLKWNQDLFAQYIIRPRMLRDISVRSQSVTLDLGRGRHVTLPSPIAIAPTASQRLCHPDGELATARAAAKRGSLMICSTIATTSLEDIAATDPRAPRWFQLYICKDRKLTELFVRRAEAANYGAIVVTVDTPISGIRRDDLRNTFTLPPHVKMANFEVLGDRMRASKTGSSGFAEFVDSLFYSGLSWNDIQWLKQITKLPVLLKGILTGEDAVKAVKMGVDGIIVSNHGARQLDSAPPTLLALQEVVAAVKGMEGARQCPILMDGGVRSGNDVFKALALGAKTVFVGRPILWGLAVGGEDGVAAILEILNRELDITMALGGCRSVEEIWNMSDLVVHKDVYQTRLAKL